MASGYLRIIVYMSVHLGNRIALMCACNVRSLFTCACFQGMRLFAHHPCERCQFDIITIINDTMAAKSRRDRIAKVGLSLQCLRLHAKGSSTYRHAFGVVKCVHDRMYAHTHTYTAWMQTYIQILCTMHLHPIDEFNYSSHS